MITTIAGCLLGSIFCIWLIGLLMRNSSSKLSTGELAFFFALKVLLGCAYGYLFLRFYGGDDTWQLFQYSVTERDHLLHTPLVFFKDFLPGASFAEGGNWWQGASIYLEQLEYFMIIKPLGILNIITGNNYYIDVVFFNFATFWGSYWLFALCNRYFPGNRNKLLAAIFLFIPLVFWFSGIRSDGLLLFFTGLLLTQFDKWLHHTNRRSLIYSLLALLGILILRDAVVLLFVPLLISWLLVVRYQRPVFNTFLIVYGLTTVLFFLSPFFLPGNGLPGMVAHRQALFFTLEGNTRFGLDPLEPGLTGFIKVLPQAFANTFLRPWLWESKGALQWMSAAEVLLVWLLVAVTLLWPATQCRALWKQPLPAALLCFSVCLYLFIGYTVPFPGAIVRYKALGELFFLLLLAISSRPWPASRLK